MSDNIVFRYIRDKARIGIMRESNKIETPMTPRVKGFEMLIHIVGWGLFFSFPFFFTGKESQVPDNKIECIRSFIIPISFMVVFYVNYCWLVKRYLFPDSEENSC